MRTLILGLSVAIAFAFVAAARWGSPTRAGPPVTSAGASAAPAPHRGRRTSKWAPGLELVQGTVVDAEGLPIEGAVVRLSRDDTKRGLLAEVETDVDGGFDANVSRPEAGAQSGLVAIEVEAVGFLAATTHVRLPSDTLRIALGRPASLVGRVVRADTGEPVPGATLDVVSASDTRSDAEGRFRVASLRPSQYTVRGRAPGLAGQARAVWVEHGETADVTVELHPAATVRGRLELTDGLPCPGGTVRLVSDVLDTALEATADAGGEVLFEALLPARYDVRLDCPDHAANQGAPPLEVDDAPLTRAFVVREELRIEGVAVDTNGDEVSAVGLSLFARSLDGASEFESVAQATRFSISGMPPGTFEIISLTGRTVAPVIVTVAERQPPPSVRVVAAEQLVLEGRVVDERGESIGDGAMIMLNEGGGASSGHGLEADGSFRFGHLRSGRVRLSVRVGSPLPILSGETEPTLPTAGPITLVVARPPEIAGRVLRAGKEVPNAGVQIACEGHEDDVRAATDLGGRFRMHVPSGDSCRLRANTDRGETASVDGVAAGASVDVELRPAATVRGVVAGAPRVFRVWTSTGSAGVFVDTRGAWKLDNVPAGEVTVLLEATGRGGRVELSLSPGEMRALDLQFSSEADEADAP